MHAIAQQFHTGNQHRLPGMVDHLYCFGDGFLKRSFIHIGQLQLFFDRDYFHRDHVARQLDIDRAPVADGHG